MNYNQFQLGICLLVFHLDVFLTWDTTNLINEPIRGMAQASISAVSLHRMAIHYWLAPIRFDQIDQIVGSRATTSRPGSFWMWWWSELTGGSRHSRPLDLLKVGGFYWESVGRWGISIVGLD